MLKQRLLVALIGIPAGVGAIVLGGYWFLGLAVVITLLGLHEFYSLMRAYRPNLLAGYTAALVGLLVTHFYGFAGVLLSLVALLVVMFFWGMAGRLGDHLTARMAVTTFGLVWVGIGFCYLILLRALDHGLALTIFAIGCTWANDTFAYFVGRAFGRRRMAPRISPSKTMEGAVGGLIGSVVFAVGVKIYSPWLPWEPALILGVVVGFAGQFGDLLESAVKRDLQVKDSGKLLPGHGGILDRFDSVLFSGFATYWGALLLVGDQVGRLLE